MINKFRYKYLKYRFVAYWKDNWQKGYFIKKNKFLINESSTCINYAQQCFEGIKCFLYKKNFFKLEKNIFRLQKSCKKIFIPIYNIFSSFTISKNLIFLNYKYIPYLKFGFLYLRPIVLGIGNNLGVKCSKKFLFIYFCSPIGKIFTKNNYMNVKKLNRVIKEFGNFKLGMNYVANIIYSYKTKLQKKNDVIYQKNIFEEFGTANFFGYFKKYIFISKNKSILPGININTFIYVFKKKKIFLKNFTNFKFINNFKGLVYCGTAIYFNFVKGITYYNKIINFINNNFIIFLRIIVLLLYKNTNSWS